MPQVSDAPARPTLLPAKGEPDACYLFYAEMAIGWGADDARVIRQLGEELSIPRMLSVRPNGFPKVRPSAVRLAACAEAESAPAPMAIAVEAPVAEPPREPTPLPAKRAPVDASAPQQGDLFARLSPRSTLP